MIIHATSIHSGGGKVLLDQLLQERNFGSIKILICDSRYILPEGISKRIEIHRVPPLIINRWKAEALLKKLSDKSPDETVLCFSNMPPAFKLKSKVILYLQNALLLPGIPLYTNSLKVKLRLTYEKIWSHIFWKNIDEVWVQTLWMKNSLMRQKKPVLVKPFLPNLPAVLELVNKKYDFITISGTATHKRLLHLLKTWSLFPDKKCPSLLVITDGSNEIFDEFFLKLSDKNVTVKFSATRDEIYRYYQESRALIVSSKIESFCLPIYEAAHFGLKIFAANEPYAKDSNVVSFYLDFKDPKITKALLENNY